MFTPPVGVRSGPGVTISWLLKSAPKIAKLDILDSTGTVLRTFEPDPARSDSAPAAAAGRGGPPRGSPGVPPQPAGFVPPTPDLLGMTHEQGAAALR